MISYYNGPFSLFSLLYCSVRSIVSQRCLTLRQEQELTLSVPSVFYLFQFIALSIVLCIVLHRSQYYTSTVFCIVGYFSQYHTPLFSVLNSIVLYCSGAGPAGGGRAHRECLLMLCVLNSIVCVCYTLLFCIVAVPDPPVEVELTECQSRFAQIQWKLISENYSPVEEFIIEYNTSFDPNHWTVAKGQLPRDRYGQGQNHLKCENCCFE